ncbi:MAG: hypothetical protein FJ284_00855 [Planctomycetes bacterium]|nr:hypothetical protein [Planctomycetota bacterium]
MSVTLASLPIWVALLPLGVYLVALGWAHLSRRPVVVAGTVDLVALAAGVSGLVLAGPLAILQPAVGTAAWATAILLGSLLLILAGGLLATRPRLVVYNVTLEQLRPLLAEVVGKLDASARWAGESVVLPARGLQVLLDGRGVARAVSVVAVGSRSSPEAWAEFARGVRRAARKLRVHRSPWGAAAVVVGLAIVAASLVWGLVGLRRDPGPEAGLHASGGLRVADRVSVPSAGFRHARARRSFGP